MATLLVEDSVFETHVVPEGHPERPARAHAIREALAGERFAGLVRHTAPSSDPATVELAHAPEYVAEIRGAIMPDAIVQVEADTFLCPQSYDVALRASTKLEPGLVARTLTRAPIGAAASPAYLAEKGVPRTQRDLKDHRLLLGFERGELPQTHWPLAGGGKLRVEGVLASNDVHLLCDAAMRGLGIALMYDDCRARIEDRVSIVTKVWAGTYQAYRTRHFVQRVRCREAGAGRVEATSNFLITMTPEGGTPTLLTSGVYRDVIELQGGQAVLRDRRAVYDADALPRYVVFPF